jgi:hypothetical protein
MGNGEWGMGSEEWEMGNSREEAKKNEKRTISCTSSIDLVL